VGTSRNRSGAGFCSHLHTNLRALERFLRAFPIHVRIVWSCETPLRAFKGGLCARNINFFRTLGVQPWIGRLMTDADDREGAPPVAVMSYHIWSDKYGSDPSVVGAGYQISGHLFTVIGVAPPGFYGAKLNGGGMPDIWIPVTTEPLLAGEAQRLKRPNANWLDILGRVRPGVNPKSLEAKLRVEFHDWLASHVPDMEPGEKQTWQQQTLHLIPGGAGVAAMRDQYEVGGLVSRTQIERLPLNGRSFLELAKLEPGVVNPSRLNEPMCKDGGALEHVVKYIADGMFDKCWRRTGCHAHSSTASIRQFLSISREATANRERGLYVRTYTHGIHRNE